MSTSSAGVARANFLARWQNATLSNVVVPYLICMVVQFPLLALYYSKLWKMSPHYQFFPFAILATAAGIYLRWPTKDAQPFIGSRFSNLCFLLGVVLGLAGAIFIFDWFAAASVYAFVVSFCARTKDGETGKSMLPVSFPLLTSLALPFNLDVTIITFLQTWSSAAASNMLDLLGYLHFLDGTILYFPDRKYGVEEACSGIMSFFVLLFITTVYVVWMHRPWFRSLLLILSGLFWAFLMNTVRIMLIPIAQMSLGIDLSAGVPHEILGYFCVVVAILLVISTDQFLSFLLGPVDPDTFESSSPLVRRITRFWNRIFSGAEPEEGSRPRRYATLSPRTMTMLLLGAVVMLLVGAVSLEGAIRSLRSGVGIRFFDDYKVTRMAAEDLPRILGESDETGRLGPGAWVALSGNSENNFYHFETRVRGSDLGIRSDVWAYNAVGGNYTAVVSFDQPFPGWHELTRCYMNNGWRMVANSRVRKVPPAESAAAGAAGAAGEPWPYIQVQFRHPLGEQGFLLFSFFDAFGEPFEAPGSWNNFNSFLERVKNRLNHRIRARLFKSESYQIQVFVRTNRPLNDADRETITRNFLKIRENLRTEFLAHRAGQYHSTPEPSSAPSIPANAPEAAANRDRAVPAGVPAQ